MRAQVRQQVAADLRRAAGAGEVGGLRRAAAVLRELFAVDRVSIARLRPVASVSRSPPTPGAAAGARHVAAGEHVLVLRRGGRGPLVPRA